MLIYDSQSKWLEEGIHTELTECITWGGIQNTLELQCIGTNALKWLWLT